MSLPESILLGVTVIVLVVMLFKQCRVLYFWVLSAAVSVVLFTLRVIG